ncbi:hypothetical protein HNY73_011729, partial [Argiope bruennichi]
MDVLHINGAVFLLKN